MSRESSKHVFVAFAALGWGCIPFGDCWPPVTANVTIASQFSDQASAPIVVAGVPRIYDADVSGVDRQGVPVTPEGLALFATAIPSSTARGATLAFRGDPYPTWYVAFLDLNENRSLDPGEPFGVDPLNPRNSHCDAHTAAIEINALRAVPSESRGAPANKALHLASAGRGWANTPPVAASAARRLAASGDRLPCSIIAVSGARS